MTSNKPDPLNVNAKKSFTLATALFPLEQWIGIDQHIFMAASRAPRSGKQSEILEQELSQARILVALGHTVYLLPEFGPRKTKHPDAIVDGLIMEFKTVSGNKRKIRENFKDARKKAENVFLVINADYTQETVLKGLIGTVRRGNYSGGMVIAHFAKAGKTYYWNIDSMK